MGSSWSHGCGIYRARRMIREAEAQALARISTHAAIKVLRGKATSVDAGGEGRTWRRSSTNNTLCEHDGLSKGSTTNAQQYRVSFVRNACAT